MATPHQIVVIVGSLRKESFSLKIANALAKLAPETLKLDVVTLNGLSFFNQDLEATPRAAPGCAGWEYRAWRDAAAAPRG
jgi:chromate reductase, NAD(P)H dehydrogenase (quinone)